jgi:predicted metalloprotease with PDZ domain
MLTLRINFESFLDFSQAPMNALQLFKTAAKQISLTGFAIAFVLTTLAAGQLVAQDDSVRPTRYTIDLADSKNHYIQIAAQVYVAPGADTTELMMATWTPGSYLVREYARHIDTLTMKDSKGNDLSFEKTRKNRWTIKTKGVKAFTASYRLYCNEMSVRTNWVGKQYAMLNGAPTFLTVPDRLDQKHLVKLKMPPNWKRSATSLKAYGENPHTFVAENFDELVDSPIVAGNIQIYPFDVSGVPHQLVNIGESGYWDGTKAVTDLKRIVKSHHDMWGNVPYDRYLFLNMIAEAGGGLEHDNSTLIMTSRWSFRDSSRYESWLSLASHEFFHTWNVRRLRPKNLVKYDYENEVYTPSLWIAEGITSYYEDLLLARAGLISSNAYLSRLSRNVETVQRTVGRTKQSLKESSYDTWIKFYRPDENSSNTRISYYSKGAVVAFLLDAKIRKITRGKKSLDDVMRKMYKEFSKSGYTTEDFRSTVADVAGKDLSEWFTSAIDSTDELDYSDIEYLGVAEPNKKARPAKSTESKPTTNPKASDKKESEKKATAESSNREDSKEDDKPARKKKKGRNSKKSTEKNEKDSDEKGSDEKEPKKSEAKKPEPKTSETEKPAAKDKKESSDASAAELKTAMQRMMGLRSSANKTPAKPRPWIGLSTSSSDGKVTVSSVKPESPAHDAGLNIDDEIIALNGYRITGSVDSRLRQYEVDEEIELLISRRGKLMPVEVTIGSSVSESWRLKFISKPTKTQLRNRSQWLGEKKK